MSVRFAKILLVVTIALSVVTGPVFSASVGTKVLRGAAIGFVITKAAKPLNTFINKVTLQHGMQSGLSTKVVPILSVGEKGYIGGAQVSGPKILVDKVKAVYQYEKNFSGNQYLAKVLVPSASVNPLKLERVAKVGVSAIIDVALDGKLKYQTVGTGIQTGDVIRGAAVLVAVKNAGSGMNKVLNTITLNKGMATKVVPMGSIGEKTYLGGAQVSASANTINAVNAVWQYDAMFDTGKFRVKVLVPTTSSNPLKMKRVNGAGVTAVINMALSDQKDIAQQRTRSRDSNGNLLESRNRDSGNDNEGRNLKNGKDNGLHKGWYKGKHKGRKHAWVDAKWQNKLNSLNVRDRDSFANWLDTRPDRNVNNFNDLYNKFLKER